MVEWLPTYEKLAIQIYPFPKGENEEPVMDERHKRVIVSYDWWVQVDVFFGCQIDEGAGDLIERHYKILEVTIDGTQ